MRRRAEHGANGCIWRLGLSPPPARCGISRNGLMMRQAVVGCKPMLAWSSVCLPSPHRVTSCASSPCRRNIAASSPVARRRPSARSTRAINAASDFEAPTAFPRGNRDRPELSVARVHQRAGSACVQRLRFSRGRFMISRAAVGPTAGFRLLRYRLRGPNTRARLPRTSGH